MLSPLRRAALVVCAAVLPLSALALPIVPVAVAWQLHASAAAVAALSAKAAITIGAHAHATGAAGAAAAAHGLAATHGAAAVHVSAHAAGATAGAHASLTGAAATGAATSALSVTPTVVTRQMQDKTNGRNTRAVGRILQIEWERFQQALAQATSSDDPVEAAKRMQEHAINRGPIIRWGMHLWVRGKLGLEGAGKTGGTIVQSLRALERELAAQIRFGLSTSPLRVARLACSALVITVLAYLSRLPWCEPLNRRIRTTWPKTVEHLASVLQRNLETDPSRAVAVTTSQESQQQLFRGRLRMGWLMAGDAPLVSRATAADDATTRRRHPLDINEMLGEPFFDPALAPRPLAS